MTRRTAPELADGVVAPGVWQRLRAAHFHDYTRPAFLMWFAIVAAGSAACAWALVGWLGSSQHQGTQLLIGLLMVAVAAWFPIEIPRSKYLMGAADVFIFTMLAMFGPAAAVLAAGVEGTVGSLRSKTRLTSSISTPMAGMAAMAVCGLLFEALWTAFAGWGWSVVVAKLAALLLTALVPFALAPLALMSTVTLKRGKWPQVREWLSASSWMAALYITSALLAGVIQLGAAGHESITVLIIGTATLGVVLLMNKSFSHNDAAHRAQEVRIREAQRESELNHQRFVGAFANAAIGMAIVNAQGQVMRANQALCTLLQRAEAELVGMPFSELVQPGDMALFARYSQGVLSGQAGEATAIELRCIAAQGAERWVDLHCGQFSDPEGLVQGLIYQLHDITARRVAEQRLHHTAYHDSLTDLANRAAFQNRVSLAIEANRLDPAAQFAVMFLDLDRFKVINDSLGHVAGNELLREVGRRLNQNLRKNDLVARLGGDEFAVLLQDLRDQDSCIRLAETMLAELSRPFSIQGHEIVPAASAGLTFSHLGPRAVDELLRDADLAMYEAKAGSPGRIAVFDRTMHARIADKLSLETDLRHAIAADELALAFQPLFDLHPHRLVGFEALARWTHPTRGVISPAVFVHLAEEAGHVQALTAWALNKAMAQLAEWHHAAPHMKHVGVQVNLSGRDLSQPRFVERVLELTQRHGLAPSALTLEITESVLMDHMEQATDSLARLRAAGVRVAIDDFGTGYSSLAYLSKLPIDSLKIDRSFVIAMDEGAEGIEVVRAVTNLGRALGKTIVAEGIETPEQLALLQRLGVHKGQGYLLGRPLKPEQAGALMAVPAAGAAVETAVGAAEAVG